MKKMRKVRKMTPDVVRDVKTKVKKVRPRAAEDCGRSFLTLKRKTVNMVNLLLQWTHLQLISFAIAHVALLVILLLKYDGGEQLQMSPLYCLA